MFCSWRGCLGISGQNAAAKHKERRRERARRCPVTGGGAKLLENMRHFFQKTQRLYLELCSQNYAFRAKSRN